MKATISRDYFQKALINPKGISITRLNDKSRADSTASSRLKKEHSADSSTNTKTRYLDAPGTHSGNILEQDKDNHPLNKSDIIKTLKYPI